MVLNKDFREFIELLNANKVQYLIINGELLKNKNCRYFSDSIKS